MSEHHTPAEPFFLWEYISDEMAERGWNSATLAAEMGGDLRINLCVLDFLEAQPESPHDHAINQMYLGKAAAYGLSRAFGTSSELWERLDESCRRSISASAKAKPSPPQPPEE